MESSADKRQKKEAYVPFLGMLTEKEILDGKTRFEVHVRDILRKVAAIKEKKQANQLSI